MARSEHATVASHIAVFLTLLEHLIQRAPLIKAHLAYIQELSIGHCIRGFLACKVEKPWTEPAAF